MTHHGTHGSHVATVSPHPMMTAWATDETCWIVTVDGERVYAESWQSAWVTLDDAKRAAEKHVGHALDWREEA